MSVLETLRLLRGQYGATMTDDECVDLINAAAWAHRAEGYGLSRKDSGTHGTRYDGVRCCHDVLMLKSGQAWDVLTGAGAASQPTWGSVGMITDPSRGWVAPIAPQGTGTGPTPPLVPPPAPVAGLTADQVREVVRAELLRAEGELAWLRGYCQEMGRALGDMRGLLEQQAVDLRNYVTHTDDVIVAQAAAPRPVRLQGNRIVGTLTGTVGKE